MTVSLEPAFGVARSELGIRKAGRAWRTRSSLPSSGDSLRHSSGRDMFRNDASCADDPLGADGQSLQNRAASTDQG